MKNFILVIEEFSPGIESTANLLAGLVPNGELRRISTLPELEKALTEQDWNLFLCNISLTGLTPLNALKQAKARFPKAPFILVADQVAGPEVLAFLRQGADGFVEKSDPVRFHEVISESLSKSSANQTQEAELSLFRNNLDTLLDTTQGALITVTLPEQRLVYASAFFEKVFGYPLESFKADHDFYQKVIHPEDLQRANEAMATCLRLGYAELEHRVILPDGKVRWLQRRVWLNYDQSGQAVLLNDSARDITEPKNAEEKLLKSQKRLAALHNIDKALLEAASLFDLAELAINHLVEMIPCFRATISTLNLDEATMEVLAVHSEVPTALVARKTYPVYKPFFEALQHGSYDLSDVVAETGDANMNRLYAEGVRSVLLVGLQIDGKLIGIMALHAQKSGYFTPELVQIALEIANQLAIGINKTALSQTLSLHVEELEQQRRELTRYGQRMRTLHNLDKGLIGGGSIEELIEITLKELRRIIPCQRADVLLLEEGKESVQFFAVNFEQDMPFGKGTRLPRHPGSFEGFDERNVRVIADFRQHLNSIPLAGQLVESGILSGARVLLMQGERPLGTLGLFADTPGFFTTDYQEIASEVGSQLAIAINQMRLTEANRRYAQRMEILHAIDLGLIRGGSIEKLVEEALENIRRIIPYARADILVIEPDGMFATMFAVNSSSQTGFGKGVRIPVTPGALEGFDERKMRLIDDFRDQTGNLLHAQAMINEGILSGLRVLFKPNGAPLGALGLFASEPGFFTAEYQEIAAEIGSQLAIAFNQMRLAEELARYSSELERRVQERTAELQATNDRLEAILFNSRDGILLVDRDLSIQQTNPAFDEMVDLLPGQGSERSLLDFVGTEDAHLVKSSVAMAVDGQANPRVEVRATRQDGTTVDIELGVGLIPGDGLVSTVHDITERKALERQLRYQASLQETVADAVIATDLSLTIQSWNRAAESLLGWSQDEVSGRFLREVLPTIYNSPESSAVGWKSFYQNGYWSGELTLYNKAGVALPVIGSAVQFKDASNNPLGIVIVLHDITERKRAEEAMAQALEQEKELGELKSRFVSMASHEFRTPLAAILATTETLIAYRDRMTSPQIDTRLDKIRQQVLHMKDIMEDVLQLARIQAGRVEYKPLPDDLDALCRDIIEEHESQTVNLGRIIYSCVNPPVQMKFDAHLMRQVISNLISNALKYSTQDKAVQVRLQRENGRIIFSVQDQGIGIPADDLKRLFEPFHRATNVGNISGTGLGMSITKQSVELHGGSITVESQEEVGTIMTLNLPDDMDDPALNPG